MIKEIAMSKWLIFYSLTGRNWPVDVAGCRADHGKRSGGRDPQSYGRLPSHRLPLRNALRYNIAYHSFHEMLL